MPGTTSLGMPELTRATRRAAVVSAGVGFLVAALIFWNTDGGFTVAAPGVGYFALLIGGLIAALAIVGATLPLVGRMTEPQTARAE